MSKEYHFLVFIGRFQPFHQGHLSVVHEGLKKAEHLIILCGSAHQPRTTRNPWTVDEREAMILSCLSDDDAKRVHVAPLMDMVYNDESWVCNVQATVNGFVTAFQTTPHKNPKIGLIGHSKDSSSYYLNRFPQWGSVVAKNYKNISATPLRQSIFNDQAEVFLRQQGGDSFSEATCDLLLKFLLTNEYKQLKSEQVFIEKYKSAWSSAPYEPTFVTVDAVVVQSGHILLVERKANPGMGLLALPGGFVDPHEKLLDACLRELREETRLKVPAPVLKGSIKDQQVFDDPYRSARGRTITHAFYMELAPNKELPRVKGGDDAKHAMWVPLADLDPSRMFDDHYFVIHEMTGA